jgi:hypothetical protein
VYEKFAEGRITEFGRYHLVALRPTIRGSFLRGVQTLMPTPPFDETGIISPFDRC